MNRAEAGELALSELRLVEREGCGCASKHLGTSTRKALTADSGTRYDVELSYHWKGDSHEEILVICTVTSKDWFSHERVEKSLTLQCDPD